uniref:Middle operon regulator, TRANSCRIPTION.2A n=1 Tax=Siphoviridae sp. ctCsv15 TaxID=2826195 RepID=A0A8S5LZ42_9CAUD|nr:MAG TPA: Middle operon regulator, TRANSCRIPTION.2A [Siphoviridae sp. ctCsv15]
MIRRQEPEEPVWAKYITEDNLPTEDLQYLCLIIGLEATKKLMFKVAGEKFAIHAYCNQSYKRQYIIDNFDGTKQCINNLALECKTTTRFVYKVLEEQVGGKNK